MKRNFARVIAALLAFALVLTAAACGGMPPTAKELEKKRGVSFDNIVCKYSEGPAWIEDPSSSFETNVTIYADGKVRIWTESYTLGGLESIVLAERMSTLSQEKRDTLISAIRENRLLALDDCTNYDILDGSWSSFYFYNANGNEVYDCGGYNCTDADYCAVEDLIFSYINFGDIDDKSRAIMTEYLRTSGYGGFSGSELLYESDLNIRCYNDEFGEFLESYYTMPAGIQANLIIDPISDGVYSRRLDAALAEQSAGGVDHDDRTDLFIVEAQNLSRYIESEYVLPLSELGYEPADTSYQYAIDAATNSKGELMAVPIYLCPGALIYRRSIAREVLGTDDPAEVQARLDTWEKFEEVAAEASAKGYYMTASFADTLRPFVGSSDAFSTLPGSDPELDTGLGKWMAQSQSFLENGYTLEHNFWSEEKNAQMAEDGKTMCFFGPAWYYTFYMDSNYYNHDSVHGDWAICQGPQAYEWGSVWLLAARGTDNYRLICNILDAFTKDDKICEYLICHEYKFPNNTEAVLDIIDNPYYAVPMLDEQNDYAVLHEVALQMQWNGMNEYRNYTTDQIPNYIIDGLQGKVPLESAVGEYNEALSVYFTKYLGIDPFGSPE